VFEQNTVEGMERRDMYRLVYMVQNYPDFTNISKYTEYINGLLTKKCI